MPWINGRFYINPAYGRALERARMAEANREWSEEVPTSGQQTVPEEDFWGDAPSSGPSQQQGSSKHWVTINGRHVLIDETRARHLSARDKAYLDKYYEAVAALAKKYDVDPALVLGVGVESGFASGGTYLRTGDAFGMTGGSTKHMTTASSPEENVRQFFANYGNQIRGTGSDADKFIDGLQGINAKGEPEPRWKIYNKVNSNWRGLVRSGAGQMRRDIPIYLSQRREGRDSR